jgi:hypothetical protein
LGFDKTKMETERDLNMENITCEFDGKTYLSGAEVCDAIKCMMCKSGEWAVTRMSPIGP